MLPPLLKRTTKCCPCHNFWHSLGHVTKWRACHDIVKRRSTKCCACYEKQRGSLDTLPKYCACTQNAGASSQLQSLKQEQKAFCARLPPVFALWKLKVDDFAHVFLENTRCFHNLSKQSQNGLFTGCRVCAALAPRFMETALMPCHNMLRVLRTCETSHCKVLRLPRESDALALTRFQSMAPATHNAKLTLHRRAKTTRLPSSIFTSQKKPQIIPARDPKQCKNKMQWSDIHSIRQSHHISPHHRHYYSYYL